MATAPDKPADDAFDVVMMHGATADGQGARVLRARPGRVDAGEVRPLQDGRPLTASGEIVRLEPRADAPAVYDVKVEHAVGAPGRPASGPAQVATRAYRESWERTFGGGKREAPS